ncbi:MAG: hypothetical protein L6422_03345, partial [Candidatus Marinimicrobia bacterium]|nr:hypothetical protein [Candidatus Neomarinimicrobiota bacterium]
PPEIFLIEAPNSFEKGDFVRFKVRATDPQGKDDISYVTFSVLKPDGIYQSGDTSGWYMLDTGPSSGLWGDEIADDGIYTITFQTELHSELQGDFTFFYFSEDIHGAVSDTIEKKITNPGVTLRSPIYSDTLYTGHIYRIKWESAYISNVKLEYTTNNNATTPSYQNIATVTASTGYYDWSVPYPYPYASSSHCKVRISDPDNPNRFDVSDNEFTIIP